MSAVHDVELGEVYELTNGPTAGRRVEVAHVDRWGCPTCRKWWAYMGSYDSDGYTLRCRGCIRAVGRCTCL